MKSEQAFIDLHEAWKRATAAGAFGVTSTDTNLAIQIRETEFYKLFTTYSAWPFSKEYLRVETYPQAGLTVFTLIDRKDKEAEDDE